MQNSNYIDDILLHSQQPQFNTAQPINYGNLYNAYEGFNVAPQVAQQPQIAQPTGQPSQAVLNATQNIVPTQAQQLEENWGRISPFNIQGHPEISRALNIPASGFNDALIIGTGLTGEIGRLWNNPKETLNEYKQSIQDYLVDLGYRSGAANPTTRTMQERIKSLANPNNYYSYNIGKDIWNAFAGTLPILNTQNVGKIAQDVIQGDTRKAIKDTKDLSYESWKQFAEHPLITGLMVAPNTTTKVLGKGASGALNLAEKAGVPVGQVSRNVAKAVQAVESKFNRDSIKLSEMADDIAKADERDLKIVLDHMDGVGELPKDLEPLYKKYSKFMNEYVKRNIDDNALVNPQELSALQYVQRQTGKTIQEIRREVAPQLEALQQGITDQSLSFRNKLSDFEHEVAKFRKENKNKDFLKDNKPITELSKEEFTTLNKYLNAEELRPFYEANSKISDIKKSIGQNVREAWYPEVKNLEKFKNAIYQENMAKLAGLAEQTGNSTLKHLYDGLRLGEEGRGIYTMAGADIPEKGLVENAGRRFQGASSSREYGTASTEEVAKATRNIHQFLDDVAAQRSRQEIGRNILSNGTIDGVHKLVGDGVKAEDIRYINPEVLANGTYTEAIKGATKNAVDGFIPIDKYNLKALESLTAPNGGFQGIWKDALNLYKEAALASGIYLGGNLASGVYGAMLNSGTPQGLIKDMVSAIGSKGALSKELGMYRRVRPRERSYSTKLGKALSWTGGWMGSRIAPRIDAFINNTISEINIHGKLRQMGIQPNERLSAVADMNKIKLANFLDDVRLNSMLNNKFRIIPRGTARDVMSVANPFIDWVDTSTQLLGKTLLDHPVLTGAVAAKLFGTIGFDRELQNRLGLQVYSDKPLVTYKADEKNPDGRKEVSISFLPQLTPLQFMADPKKLVIGSSGMPVLTAIYEASKGNTAYGNPMRRTFSKDSVMSIVGNDRYRVNPETGLLEKINETQADEVLSTAIKNLMAPPNMWNKTIAPTGVALRNLITGSNDKWYMPYGQSIFGSTKIGQPELGGFSRNIISTGDPTKERTMEDIIKGLGTMYEMNYYPKDSLTGNQIRRVKRAGARQSRRIYGDE